MDAERQHLHLIQAKPWISRLTPFPFLRQRIKLEKNTKSWKILDSGLLRDSNAYFKLQKLSSFTKNKKNNKSLNIAHVSDRNMNWNHLTHLTCFSQKDLEKKCKVIHQGSNLHSDHSTWRQRNPLFAPPHVPPSFTPPLAHIRHRHQSCLLYSGCNMQLITESLESMAGSRWVRKMLVQMKTHMIQHVFFHIFSAAWLAPHWWNHVSLFFGLDLLQTTEQPKIGTSSRNIFTPPASPLNCIAHMRFEARTTSPARISHVGDSILYAATWPGALQIVENVEGGQIGSSFNSALAWK